MSSQPDQSARSHPAVSLCCQAWRKAYDRSLSGGQDQESARSEAKFAYCEAMPPLLGVRNIRNFIACVTYASLDGIIKARECSRLLYAAQVAHTIRRIRKPGEKAGRGAEQKKPSAALQEPIRAS